MRATGVAIMVVGLSILTYCAIMWGMYYAEAPGDAGQTAYNRRIARNFMIPLAISGGTVTVGLGLAILGDKGFKFSRNLAERN